MAITRKTRQRKFRLLTCVVQNSNWDTTFHRIYDQALKTYRSGNRNPKNFFNPNDGSFLASIGCTGQELYDFAEDGCNDGEPSFETVLLITAARRDYLLAEQSGQLSKRVISMADLPAKHAELGGIAWLPRLIAKAQAKLRGEMPPELMYGCGGDRPFLQSVNIHLADFLRFVWSVDGDSEKVLDYVKRSAGR